MARTGPDPDSGNTHSMETSRLVIDLPTPNDASDLYELVGGEQRDEVCATLVWDGPADIEEVERWISRCVSDAYGEWGYHWVIRDRRGEITGRPGAVLGAIGTRPTGQAGRADVGYWLGRPFWGNGIMAEALQAVLALGFDALAYAKIEADVFTTNERGLRLVESAGMRREGTIRRAVWKRGEWVDTALYGMLAEEHTPPA
jgi:RimJ/RimL family protein N-acetyltransferase